MSKKLVTKEIPDIIPVSSEELGTSEKFILIHLYKHNAQEPFVVCAKGRETILINEQLPNIKETMKLINKIMEAKYLDKAEDLFDQFEKLHGKDAAAVLLNIWMDWRKEVQGVDRHKRGMDALSEIKKGRLIQKSKKCSDIIQELFNIGFGLYDDGTKCDCSKGAEYVYAYGYMQGLKAAETKQKARAVS